MNFLTQFKKIGVIWDLNTQQVVSVVSAPKLVSVAPEVHLQRILFFHFFANNAA
jgi:hypothetical protein